MQIKLRSGLQGTAERLQERYGTLESFRVWESNPTIASSVEPSDLCTVLDDGRQIYADEQEVIDRADADSSRL
jgi:hypothetical protein